MIPSHCKTVSVTEVDYPLTHAGIGENLLGQKVFTRTEYMILRRGGELATARVRKRRSFQLFLPVTQVEVLSTPESTLLARDPTVDILNATRMYRCGLKAVEENGGKKAGGDGDDEADPLRGWTVVVEGVDGHISFVHRPKPFTIKLLDLVPPHPSKLMRLLESAVDFAELGTEPVEFAPTILDINELAEEMMAEGKFSRENPESDAGGEPDGAGCAEGPNSHVMFPCEASGLGCGPQGAVGPFGAVRYLDKTPKLTEGERDGTVLVGCDTSRMIFRSLYGKSPRLIDMCPRHLLKARPDLARGPALVRCCKVGTEYLRDGDVIVLPWGPSLRMVADALEELTGVWEEEEEGTDGQQKRGGRGARSRGRKSAPGEPNVGAC
jgi:hypothetical protein